jgi:lipoprotein
MNLLRTYGTALLVAITFGVSACKHDEAPVATTLDGKEAVREQKISLDVEIEDVDSDEFRMILEEKMEGNKHAGLKFAWKTGETAKAYLAFKKGGNITVQKGTLKVIKQVGNRHQARIEFTMPSGINPDAGNVLVAGAIGVSGIDAQGRAIIPGPRNFYDAGERYDLPMYFASTRLHSKMVNGEKHYYGENTTFYFFGAMVGATIDNTKGNMPYYPHEITMKTGALTTEGAMNLFDTESDGTKSVPKWETQQDETTVQRVYFEQGEVAIGKKHTYYFWAVPSKFSGRRPMTAEFRTDAYDNTLGATASEITTKWTVKQLANEKVHRLKADILAPKGDLIISEVFVGGGEGATAWEVYNPTEKDINLANYYIQRFDYDKNDSGYQYFPQWESRLLPETYQIYNKNNSLEKHTWSGLERGVLRPHKSAVFYTAAVTNKWEMPQFRNREGLIYVFNIASDILGNGEQKKYAKAFFAPLTIDHGQRYRSRHRIIYKAPNGDQTPVDAFFYYSGDRKSQYPSATFFRKPGRDLPRSEMHIRDNSDWVMRQRYEAVDWGYRFSYYFDRERLSTKALGIHWMEDHSTGSTIPGSSVDNGYILERPIFAPNYERDNMNFAELIGQAQLYRYVPPIWWTRVRAQQADR